MNMEKTVEHLAFGRSMPKFDSCIGLSITGDVIFISEIRLKVGKPVVEHLLRVPIPAASSGKDTVIRVAGSLNTEVLTDTERLFGLLSSVLGQTKWGSKYLVASISQQFGLLRYFAMPVIDHKFWKTAIPTEAKKYIPIPFTDLVYDFQVQPLPLGPDKRSRQGVLFGVTHRKNVEGITALCEKLGLTLLGLEIGPCSVERLWDVLSGQAPSSSYLQVHFDAGWVRVVLSENGVPVFFREIMLPEEGGSLDMRKVDLLGCIEYCKKQLGAKPPSDIRISGTNPALTAWREAFFQELGMPVQFQDTPKALGLRVGEWGGYAALGGALKYLVPTAIKLDMGPIPRISEEEKRAVYTIFSLTGIATGIMLLIGLFRFSQIAVRSSALAKVERQNATVPAIKGQSVEDIKKLISGMEEKANGFASFSGVRVGFMRLMEVIAEDVPDPLWITQMNYTSPIGEMGGKKRESRTLKLVGQAAGGNPGAEQDIAIQFKEKLQMDERFNKLFICSGPSVTVAAVEGRERPAEPASSRAAGQMTHTNRASFTIDCTSKGRQP